MHEVWGWGFHHDPCLGDQSFVFLKMSCLEQKTSIAEGDQMLRVQGTMIFGVTKVQLIRFFEHLFIVT